MEKIKSFLKENSEDIKIALMALIITGLLAIAIIFKFGMTGFSDFSAFLQYVTTVLALLAWNNTRILVAKKRRAKVKAESDDLILTISLSNNINADVKKYVETDQDLNTLKEISIPDSLDKNNPKTEILSVDNKYMLLKINTDIKGALTIEKIANMPDDEIGIIDYVREFRNCINEVYTIMNNNNKNKAHVFFSAPGELAAYISPAFVNTKTVIMYRFIDGAGTYIPMGEAGKARL